MLSPPREMLCLPGAPPVDAEVWRRVVRDLIYNRGRGVAAADFESLTPYHQGIVERTRANWRFRELIDDPTKITPEDMVVIDRHDAEQARLGVAGPSRREQLVDIIGYTLSKIRALRVGR